MGRIIAVHDVAFNRQSVSNKLIRQVLDYGSLLPASMRDRWNQIGALDYLAGDADYVFLGLDENDWDAGESPWIRKSSFLFDAEHLIGLGAIVRDEDLIDDYTGVARDAALEIITFDVPKNQFKDIEDHVDVLNLVQRAVRKTHKSSLNEPQYESNSNVYRWYKKLDAAGLVGPMLDAVHHALVDFKKQYDHTGKDALKKIRKSMDDSKEAEILWHGPLPLLYALPESPAFQVK
jgi:hypothetical protein